MKNIIIILLTSFFIMSCSNKADIQKADINIIPKPQNITIGNGNFIINNNTSIISSDLSVSAEKLLREVLVFEVKNENKTDNAITFKSDKSLSKEAYTIEISEKGIFIISGSKQGFVWAIRSLQQMLPVDYRGINDNYSLSIPYLKIDDSPAFGWRGSLLDVGRHFMPVEKVKEYINLLSYNKMNVFHWHLTEDQGWRIEIKKYPKLTELGAWRKDGKGGKYGGFYTQEEIKDVVKYAEGRGVTIVPEIEFPGHSLGALTAYPELSCTDGLFEVQTNWGVFDDILCAGNDEVFVFAENVLAEVLDLFPSKYIHIGGDEAPKLRWENCDKCQARIKEEGLKNEHDLQSYFISRLEKFLVSHNRKLIGWDEIMEGGLAPEATMQVWRDVEYGKKAIEEGHDIISSPTSHCYLDYSQKQIDVEKIYSFNPIPEGVSGEAVKHVLGGEGNLWTERIPPSRLNYMAFPRITALSEALWTKTENKDYGDFYKRLQKQYLTLDKMGINYGPEGDIMDIESGVTENNGFKVTINPKAKGVSFKYSFSDKPNILLDYTKPIEFKKTTTINIQAYRNSIKYGEKQSLSFIDHKARGAKLELENQPSEAYSGNPNTIIDGLLGSINFRDGKWQGFNGDNLVATLSFEQTLEIEEVIVNFQSNVSSWIFSPKSVSVFVSEDGKNFVKIASIKNTEAYQGTKDELKSFEIKFDKTKTKVLKVIAENYGIIPNWHSGRGQKAYMFIDELIVN